MFANFFVTKLGESSYQYYIWDTGKGNKKKEMRDKG